MTAGGHMHIDVLTFWPNYVLEGVSDLDDGLPGAWQEAPTDSSRGRPS